MESISAMTNAMAIVLSGVDGIGMDGYDERRELQEQNVSRDETLLITVYDNQLVGQLIEAPRGDNLFAKQG
jgi:hypothetical protein